VDPVVAFVTALGGAAQGCVEIGSFIGLVLLCQGGYQAFALSHKLFAQFDSRFDMFSNLQCVFAAAHLFAGAPPVMVDERPPFPRTRNFFPNHNTHLASLFTVLYSPFVHF